MSEWIMLWDELPQSEQEVLVTVEANTDYDGGIRVNRSVTTAMFFNSEDWGWYPYFELGVGEHNECTKEIVAWMPLPGPYEKED